MKTFLKSFLIAGLLLSSQAHAYSDEEFIKFNSAITSGDILTVETLISNNTVNVNNLAFGWTPILTAANTKQNDIVQLLILMGADVNQKHPTTKMTALAIAVYDNNVDLVKILISNKADVNAKLKGGVPILRIAKDQKNTEIVKLLLDNGANENSGCWEEKCF